MSFKTLLQRPEWAGDAAKMEESFPALGAGPAAAPKGAWGTGDAVSRLSKIAAQGKYLVTHIVHVNELQLGELIVVGTMSTYLPSAERLTELCHAKRSTMLEKESQEVVKTQGCMH